MGGISGEDIRVSLPLPEGGTLLRWTPAFSAGSGFCRALDQMIAHDVSRPKGTLGSRNDWSAIAQHDADIPHPTAEVNAAPHCVRDGADPPQVVDRFLRLDLDTSQERVVLRVLGITNGINAETVALRLTPKELGHISAPPRGRAGSRQMPRRSWTSGTVTSQAVRPQSFTRAGLRSSRYARAFALRRCLKWAETT